MCVCVRMGMIIRVCRACCDSYHTGSKVVYKLKATLDVAGRGMKDLKAKVPVTVFVRPAGVSGSNVTGRVCRCVCWAVFAAIGSFPTAND